MVKSWGWAVTCSWAQLPQVLGETLASERTISVALESRELPGRETRGPHVASRVFHAGAFPAGANHPLMGPEDHSAHPGWAMVAGSHMTSDLQGAICSCLGLSRATGGPWVCCTLTGEPAASCLLSCPPHTFSSDPSPSPLHPGILVVASGFLIDSWAHGDPLPSPGEPTTDMMSSLLSGPAGGALWELRLKNHQ